MSGMTPAFDHAFQRVIRDVQLDEGEGADLIAVGVERSDCLALLAEMVRGEAITAELLAITVQFAVAVGVWLERERWQPTEEMG